MFALVALEDAGDNYNNDMTRYVLSLLEITQP
jgi:hypothetical protein